MPCRACNTSWTACAGRAFRSRYDVETNGAMEKIELPFVVGVLADLSGQPTKPLRPLKERKAVNIDRDNFNDVLAKSAPRVAMKVQNRLTGEDTKLAVELNFKSHGRLRAGPGRRAGRPRSRSCWRCGCELTQLLSKMEGNDKLDQLLADVLEQHREGQGAGQPDGHRRIGRFGDGTPEAEETS